MVWRQRSCSQCHINDSMPPLCRYCGHLDLPDLRTVYDAKPVYRWPPGMPAGDA